MANKCSLDLLAVGSDRSPVAGSRGLRQGDLSTRRRCPVRAAALARYLNVSRVSVSKAKRLLESRGSARSSRRVRREAAAVQRRAASASPSRWCGAIVCSRPFSTDPLHVPLERVHAEAERIEHVISDDLALRIAALLGQPASRSARASHSLWRRSLAATGVARRWRRCRAARVGARREPRRSRRRCRRNARRRRRASRHDACASSGAIAAKIVVRCGNARSSRCSPSRGDGARCNVATASARPARASLPPAHEALAGNGAACARSAVYRPRVRGVGRLHGPRKLRDQHSRRRGVRISVALGGRAGKS